MDFNTDLVIAQEFDWMYQNETGFQVDNKSFTGKVGRTEEGEDIIIKIILPEFYPIVRPEIEMLSRIKHPNITPDGHLELQMMDEWDPNFRLKDIISSARRLFIRSKGAIKSEQPVMKTTSGTEKKIAGVQAELNEYNQKINELKAKQLQNAGVNTAVTGSMKITKKLDLECQLLALGDLLEILEIKFEEAGIEQTDFFRLYKKYSKELYMSQKEFEKLGENYNDVEKKTERSIRN